MGKVYRAKNVTLERDRRAEDARPASSRPTQAFVQRFLKEARVGGAPEPSEHRPDLRLRTASTRSTTSRWSTSTGSRCGALPEARPLQRARRDPASSATRCRALAVAHAAGHRPPRHQARQPHAHEPGEVKLVDLGIAKRIDEDQSLTQTGQAIGTPHYISPEQIRGLKDIDARADIYSLGATLYHLVTGHAPYKGTSGALVMSMHLDAPAARPAPVRAGALGRALPRAPQDDGEGPRRAVPRTSTRSTATSTSCRPARCRSRTSRARRHRDLRELRAQRRARRGAARLRSAAPPPPRPSRRSRGQGRRRPRRPRPRRRPQPRSARRTCTSSKSSSPGTSARSPACSSRRRRSPRRTSSRSPPRSRRTSPTKRAAARSAPSSARGPARARRILRALLVTPADPRSSPAVRARGRRSRGGPRP